MVGSGSRSVIIDTAARAQLRQAYDYIAADSPQNAKKVRTKILASIQSLAAYPERHPVDKYKKENDGSFRAYELYHYRIAYHVGVDEIRVVRIRHTKMNPLHY